MPELVTAVSLWELLKHAATWLRNLNGASKERKQVSVEAVRDVIKASRITAVYMRRLKSKRKRSFDTEIRLSETWTDLGFRLSDLGMDQLAKKCEIKGRHWADPDQFEDDFLEKADIKLETMEKTARAILGEISK